MLWYRQKFTWSDGEITYNPGTSGMWAVLSINKLSAITANLGTVTAGEMQVLSNNRIVARIGTAATIGGVSYPNGIFAEAGKIGGFDIGTSDIHNTKVSMEAAGNGTYFGTDGLALGDAVKIYSNGAGIEIREDISDTFQKLVYISTHGAQFTYKYRESPTDPWEWGDSPLQINYGDSASIDIEDLFTGQVYSISPETIANIMRKPVVVTATLTGTLTKSTASSFSKAVSVPSGYTAVGIIQITNNHSTVAKITRFYMSGNTANVTMWNSGSTTYTDMSITVYVLCI